MTDGQVVDIARRGKRARTNKLLKVPPGRVKNVDLSTKTAYESVNRKVVGIELERGEWWVPA